MFAVTELWLNPVWASFGLHVLASCVVHNHVCVVAGVSIFARLYPYWTWVTKCVFRTFFAKIFWICPLIKIFKWLTTRTPPSSSMTLTFLTWHTFFRCQLLSSDLNVLHRVLWKNSTYLYFSSLVLCRHNIVFHINPIQVVQAWRNIFFHKNLPIIICQVII